MIPTETKIDWLQNIINQKKKHIQRLRLISYRTIIFNNLNRNPIEKLDYEIKIAQELMDMENESVVKNKLSVFQEVWQKWCESKSTQEFDKWLHDKLNES